NSTAGWHQVGGAEPCDQLLYSSRRFLFQAEDGIRDATVTGVQTCALPISKSVRPSNAVRRGPGQKPATPPTSTPITIDRRTANKIGRASCRERVEQSVVGGGCHIKIARVDSHLARHGQLSRAENDAAQQRM